MNENDDSPRTGAPIIGLGTVSRRTFIRCAALGVAAVAVTKWNRAIREPGPCLVCSAVVTPHEWREAGRIGRYCPNCGIEMTRQRWDLPLRAAHAPAWVATRVARDSGIWSFNHVPFPNRQLVQNTSKPAVGRMEIRW